MTHQHLSRCAARATLTRANARRAAAGAPLDFAAQVAAQAGEKRHFGDDEQRPDRQPDQIVDERGLASLEPMTDELHDPADHERADADAEPARRRQQRDGVRRPQADGEQRGHREPEAQIQAQVERRERGREQQRRRPRDAGQRAEQRPRQQHLDREHDQRNADQMGRDVAHVAVVGRILGQVVFEGLHRVS
jgi:hypothetical protein